MTDEPAERTLSPDEAFEVLGNETRVGILQALGGADAPVSFTELREDVGMTDSGRFNYHLDRLTGHFVRKGEAGYELRRAGERVVEAVLSGAVTAAPVLERTEIDQPCHYCGAPIAVRFREERVELYCTECPGTYSRTDSDDETCIDADADDGYLGYHPLPPAGVADRDPEAVFRAAWVWGHLELLAASAGVCPRCSATLDRSTRVCEDHDPDESLCDACGRRYAVVFDLECTNCIYDESGAAVVGLADSAALVAFMLDHGLNPFAPTVETLPAISRAYNNFDEEVVSTEPFEARFTFAVGNDELTLTVDDSLRVADADRN
ncbi:winged helix-turn-helix domain-containing protein [Halosimplex amylolyticum]|uniref:winged helix-turn-helix domain-containing protein n=1 Tax=Halosimplex amylolyticum TaxID=3396616 RepID=UPI003F54324D